ncbi:MAG: acyltransferase [Prevotellaceae bacterium]|jgi:galactoside O-acetyltransferase|nr:acyltransferase [Prevotellaceae bacterium]
MTSFYSEKELLELGLKSFGRNVFISRKCSIYSPAKISIGDNVRIDDFCVLSGEIALGNNIHIAAYCALYGAFGIEMEDYTGLSPRCTVFSATDDFSGDYLISPMVDKSKTNVTGGKVLIKKYSQIGANCVIFPGVTIEEGCAVGTMSLINRSLEGWGIYAGIPAKRIKDRKKGLLKLL